MLSGIVLTILSLIFIWILRRLRQPDKLAHINGPKGVPLLGNAPQLNPAAVVHLKLTEWAKQFGSLYKILMVDKPVVVVSGYKEIYEVLLTKGKDFAGRTNSFRMNFMMENQSDFLSMDYCPESQYRKKILHSHLKHYGEGVTYIENVTIESVNNMLINILEFKENPIEIVDLTQKLLVDITYTIVLGKKQDSPREREDIIKMTSLMSAILSASGNGVWLDIFPWLRFFGFNTYKQLLDMKNIRHRLHSIWDATSEDSSVDKNSNLVYKMKRMMEKDGRLSEQSIEVLTMTLFLGATSTTVSTLAFLISVLAHNPHIEEKLQKEIDVNVGRDGVIRFKERSRLPYHYATILEGLRMSTVLPIGIPHKAMCDTDICGQRIPKDCSIWVNLWALHHDETVWGDPFVFRPERFLQEANDNSISVVPPDHPLRMSLMPFGAGPRVCTGEMFAMTRMLLILSMFMQKLTILPETTVDEQPSCDPRTMKLGGVLMPEPFMVRLVERP